VVLEIAKATGLTPDRVRDMITERHKRLKGKTVTAKYLLTAIIPDLQELQEKANDESSAETHKLMII
jgi:hypothetical protein